MTELTPVQRDRLRHMGRRATEAKEALAKELQAAFDRGNSSREIADALGWSVERVGNRRRRAARRSG